MCKEHYSKNPLDEISDSDFEEFLIAKQNDFTRLIENGEVIYDYYKWRHIFHNLQWYCYFHHEDIFKKRNIKISLTTEITEIMDLLISERKQSLKQPKQ